MVTYDNANSKLLRKTLEQLKNSFSELGASVIYDVILDESPYVSTNENFIDLPAEAEKIPHVFYYNFAYRKSELLPDEQGQNIHPRTQYYDMFGEPIVNKNGQPVGFAHCGSFREITIIGRNKIPFSVYERFIEFVKDASVAVFDNPPGCINSLFPEHTIDLDRTVERWFCALFDLAWRNERGSPLRISVDKSVIINESHYLLDTIEEKAINDRELAQGLSLHGRPLKWFARIDDAVQASIYACDILLNNLPERDDEANSGDSADDGFRETEQVTSPLEKINPDSYLTHRGLAKLCNLPPEALRKRLDRWRGENSDGYKEITDNKSREPKYMYKFSAVKPLIDKMMSKKTSGQTSAKRPAK